MNKNSEVLGVPKIKYTSKEIGMIIFKSLFMLPLPVGCIMFLCQIVGIINISWWLVALPFIVSYSSFTIALVYAAFLEDKVKAILNRIKNRSQIK